MVTRSHQLVPRASRLRRTVGICVSAWLSVGCSQTAEVLTKRVRAEQHPAAPEIVDAGAPEPDADPNDELSSSTGTQPASTSNVTSSSREWDAPDAASTSDETDEPRTEVLQAPPLAVGTGFATTCVIVNDDRTSVLLCFGQEAIDPVGLSEEDRVNQTRFVAVTGGEHHMCTVTSFGDVYCWGDNEHGQLGSPELDRTQKPKRAWLPEPATQLASGANHACAITLAGQLYCWGDNGDGQLGLDETSDDQRELGEPTLVDAGPWISVAAGAAHTCGVKSDGSLSCWGRNNELQAGNTGENPIRTPRLVNTEHSWRQVAIGQSHSCALRTDGSLWCWGSNASEDADYPIGEQAMWQLSDPTPIGDGRWTALTSHWSHNCAITDSHELWCWGHNDAGQLGTGDTELRRTATSVASGANQAALGLSHSCVVIEDNDVLCTGSNEHGQLGLPNEADQTTFTSLREEWERFLELQFER